MKDRFEVRVENTEMATFRFETHALDYARRMSLEDTKLWMMFDIIGQKKPVCFRAGLEVVL